VKIKITMPVADRDVKRKLSDEQSAKIPINIIIRTAATRTSGHVAGCAWSEVTAARHTTQ
jgi:hypothetical protein